MKEESFIMWCVMTFMSLVIQCLGETFIPEIRNFGILSMLAFILAGFMDYTNKKGGAE